jgi:hypothetical protein
VYEEGGAGKSSSGEDSGSATAASRVAHRRTKKVAQRCSSFGDGGVEGGGIRGGVEGGSPAYEEGGGGAEVG